MPQCIRCKSRIGLDHTTTDGVLCNNCFTAIGGETQSNLAVDVNSDIRKDDESTDNIESMGGNLNSIMAHESLSSEVPNKTAIIIVSALFGPFGAIPANTAAKKAEAKGLPTRPYWKAFWVTWLISSAVLIAVKLIFFAVVISSLNASLNSQALSGSAGTTRTVVDCTIAGNTIDVDGTICKQTSGNWSPPTYVQYTQFGADLALKWAIPGSYSCTDGDVHCQELYVISQTGCKNGITVQLGLQNSDGVSIGEATQTSRPEQPMEIVQMMLGNTMQDWAHSTLTELKC